MKKLRFEHLSKSASQTSQTSQRRRTNAFSHVTTIYFQKVFVTNVTISTPPQKFVTRLSQKCNTAKPTAAMRSAIVTFVTRKTKFTLKGAL